MAGITQVSSNKCFGGFQKVFSHESEELKCKINFAVYLPPKAEDANVKLPVIYWLSGLTCNEQNFIQKAGGQKLAANHQFIIVCPDTSPRGCGIEGEEDSWDFGTGAGFYVDAKEEKWKTNYRMFSYITKELPQLISANFPADSSLMSIMGHSMGGHGALICALKNPGLYKSVSAFAPICNPVKCPWGEKAFSGYLGADKTLWEEWDATCLVANYQGAPLQIFVDQGEEDQFLKDGQLLPDNLVESCAKAGMPIILRKQAGYDHSYYFIATYLEDHFSHHAKFLQ